MIPAQVKSVNGSSFVVFMYMMVYIFMYVHVVHTHNNTRTQAYILPRS
jgi:hypothetical protein